MDRVGDRTLVRTGFWGQVGHRQEWRTVREKEKTKGLAKGYTSV